MNVNDVIRATVRRTLDERGMTQTELATRLGVTPQALSRTLTERGKPAGLWQSILDELGLELVVRVKDTTDDQPR